MACLYKHVSSYFSNFCKAGTAGLLLRIWNCFRVKIDVNGVSRERMERGDFLCSLIACVVFCQSFHEPYLMHLSRESRKPFVGITITKTLANFLEYIIGYRELAHFFITKCFLKPSVVCYFQWWLSFLIQLVTMATNVDNLFSTIIIYFFFMHRIKDFCQCLHDLTTRIKF